MDTQDLPDFLGGEPTPATEPQADAAPAAAAPAAAPAPAAEGPARDAAGKFAPAAPTPAIAPAAEPAATPDPAQQPAQGQEAHHVPLATALDWRDRMTAAEKEARELREWRQQQERQAQLPVQVPDKATDPEGYERYQQAVIAEQFFVQSRDFSRRLAEMQFGPQVTNAAFEWGAERCDTDPHFNAKVRAQPDPMGFVVSEWQRDQALAQVSDPKELEAFRAWKASQAGGQPAGAQPAAAPPAAPAAPRQSLAASPSAGASAGPVPQDGEAIFNEMFG